MGGKRVGSDPVVEHLSLPSVVQDTELGGTLARPALGQLHMEPQRGNHSLTRLEGGITLCSAALSIKLMMKVQNYCGQRVSVF